MVKSKSYGMSKVVIYTYLDYQKKKNRDKEEMS